MNTIIPIASGKEGVGKTIFTATLGITLSKMGKTVLFDSNEDLEILGDFI